MEKQIKCEVYCHNCGLEKDYDSEYDAPHECPKCGKWLHRSYHITCDCGEDVWLTSNYNECDCGRAYNRFGQQLADPNEWDDEDRYGTFGPQNEDY